MITSNIALVLIIQELARMMLAYFSSFKTKCVSNILELFWDVLNCLSRIDHLLNFHNLFL